MAWDAYPRVAYRIFKRPAMAIVSDNPRLRSSLQRANVSMRPEAYMAVVLSAMAFTFVLLFIPLLGALATMAAGVEVPGSLLIITLPAPFLGPLIIFGGSFILPDLKANGRGRDIDAKLPYALNYVATMASAGATPERLFDSLSRQNVYGEVSIEAARIRRDLQLLGKDIVGAMAAAADRSPSARWQDLLQGAITALTSGGDLEVYFRNKADQYVIENRQNQKGFLESLGVLAESFVTVVVAAPLFLLVILSVMTTFGASPQQMLTIGYMIVLVMLPLAQAAFSFTIKTMTPEA